MVPVLIAGLLAMVTDVTARVRMEEALRRSEEKYRSLYERTPVMVHSMITAFQALKAAGETILLVEQNFHAASILGDRVVVVDDGRVAHAGTMRDLVADQALQHRLLGLSMDAHQ